MPASRSPIECWRGSRRSSARRRGPGRGAPEMSIGELAAGLGVGLVGGITSGLLGVSPGGGLVVFSNLLLGAEQHVAQGISLVAQIPPTSLSGIRRYWEKGSRDSGKLAGAADHRLSRRRHCGGAGGGRRFKRGAEVDLCCLPERIGCDAGVAARTSAGRVGRRKPFRTDPLVGVASGRNSSPGFRPDSWELAVASRSLSV